KTLPQLFKENGYVTVRAGKINHGGLDDAPSWGATSDKGGPTDDGSDPVAGHNLEVPRAQIPMPNGVLPPLPADNARSAYSDRIVVLDGNGEGHGDFHTADRTIENLRKYKDQPFFIACGFVKPHSPPSASATPICSSGAARAKPRPDKSSAPISPRFRGWTGTLAACSASWTNSACAKTPSSCLCATTVISWAKKANGRRPVHCLKWARACR